MAVVSSRYARAFVEVIIDVRLDPDRALQELTAMTELLKSNPELRTVLQNPSVPHPQKLKVLDSIISLLGASKVLRNFVAVLIDHRRLGQMEEIAEKFRHELNERLGIAEAQVSSSRELGREERQMLEQQIAAVTGKSVRATYSRDASLLGGATVRIGSILYDGSVRGQLRRIKEQMAQG
ncbi:MAG TPA: ATP synthase F1 subunit delta [Candidatus Angelobacter sp.]